MHPHTYGVTLINPRAHLVLIIKAHTCPEALAEAFERLAFGAFGSLLTGWHVVKLD